MKLSSLSFLTHPAVFMAVVFMAVVLAAVPARAQETILGNFEGQQHSGQASGGNAGTGAMVLRGWALADSGVRQVIIQVDGPGGREAATRWGLPGCSPKPARYGAPR